MNRVVPAAFEIPIGDGLTFTSSGEVKADISFSDITDAAISSPQADEVLQYNDLLNKWNNAAVSGGSSIGNIDGGEPSSNYGGIDAIDGGQI